MNTLTDFQFILYRLWITFYLFDGWTWGYDADRDFFHFGLGPLLISWCRAKDRHWPPRD